MKISSKLMIIVVLTCFEISLTLWSVFEIAKGSTFHQLNFLHLKYSEAFSKHTTSLENGAVLNISRLKSDINNIRQQPMECLAKANVLNRFIMKKIGTEYALIICEQDIIDADKALDYISQFDKKIISRERLIIELKNSASKFNENSVLFEKPITDTVSFIMRTMIPLVIFISLLNIFLISYMSRNITGSINNVIKLLSNKNNKESLEADINENVSGELKILLEVAKNRLTNELVITEVNKKLESLVDQRTFSLTRANEELAQFAYRASHDLKAPLTSTKQLTQFIKEDIKDGQLESALDDLDKVTYQMGKLEELVVGILALTEADSIDQGFVSIDFKSILLSVKSANNDLLTMNNCTFEEEIKINEPMHAQKVRVIQILENLVSNAIKYSNPTRDKSFVKARVFEDDNNYIIEVEDNGLGIPESRRGEIFQMFKRFHPNVSFGSGLGMAIVKKHVDYMKGTIGMTTSDAGTMFTIIFLKENIK